MTTCNSCCKALFICAKVLSLRVVSRKRSAMRLEIASNRRAPTRGSSLSSRMSAVRERTAA
ncbi:MAG: hypothetical protein A3B67_12240 [Burkholderiales bacterium RIFCSPHIGHO2_02_FULL_66_10]|nr:MAG: hypothetical protein A3B67_12240 [Burkholderiales bacterium RIFCSPHIGHO2_02_FULL_66_10]